MTTGLGILTQFVYPAVELVLRAVYTTHVRHGNLTLGVVYIHYVNLQYKHNQLYLIIIIIIV